MILTNIAIRYGLFCVFAIAINIITQFMFDQFFLKIDMPKVLFINSEIISLGIGTFTGLVAKFFLDKKYIFNASFDTPNQTLTGFILYTAMGLVTTVIFWGSELGAYEIFNNNGIKYFAGVVGLTIGYYIKYHLDKKFVFNASTSNQS
jgi:hypothetical protein